MRRRRRRRRRRGRGGGEQKINGHACIKSAEYSSGIEAASRGLVKFSAVSGNLRVHDRVYEIPPLVPAASHMIYGSGFSFASLSVGEMKGKQGNGAQPRNTNHISAPHFFTIYPSIPRLSNVFLPSCFSAEILYSLTTHPMPSQFVQKFTRKIGTEETV